MGGRCAQASIATFVTSSIGHDLGYDNRHMKLCLLLLSGTMVLTAAAETSVTLSNNPADLHAERSCFRSIAPCAMDPKATAAAGLRLTKAKLTRAPTDAALVKVIEDGIRGTEMPGAGAMSEREMRQTAAYVRSLGKVVQKPVPGNPAHGAEIYLSKGNWRAATPYMARVESSGRIFHHRRLAQRCLSP